jgi:DNA-binding HxlR family transcriptional regulator
MSSKRSCCPISICLDIYGDKWTLLIIRDLFLGRSRFKEFLASPEGMASNLLSERLARLLENGIIQYAESSDGSKYKAYCLTPKGEALYPVINAMKDWALDWHPEAKALLS